MAAPTTIVDVTVGKITADVAAKIDSTVTATTDAKLDGKITANVNLVPPVVPPDPAALARDIRKFAMQTAMDLRPRKSCKADEVIHCAKHIAAYITDGT